MLNACVEVDCIRHGEVVRKQARGLLEDCTLRTARSAEGGPTIASSCCWTNGEEIDREFAGETGWTVREAEGPANRDAGYPGRQVRQKRAVHGKAACAARAEHCAFDELVDGQKGVVINSRTRPHQRSAIPGDAPT